MIVLNGYLVLNFVIVTYLLFSLWRKREPRKSIFVPLVLFSIPAAIGIHTVTAFLYNGMAARPFWNASILAPRFIASALCSGPAVLLILMQLAESLMADMAFEERHLLCAGSLHIRQITKHLEES